MSVVRTSTGTLQRSDDEEYPIVGLTQIAGADTYFYPLGNGMQEVAPVGGGSPDWAPFNADIALNYSSNEYWRRGVGYVASPIALSRASSAWRTAEDGKAIAEAGNNQPRRDARGLYLEGYDRVRLSRYPATPADWLASSSPAVTRATQAADGSFTPQIVSRPVGGAAFSAIQESNGFAVVSGERLSLKSLFKAGTSGRYRAALRRTGDGNTVSTLNGAIGALASTVNTLGTWTDIAQYDRSTDAKELLASITPASSQADVKLELGPDAAADGGGVTICGGQITRERFPCEWILGTPASGFSQDDDKASLPVTGAKTISHDFNLLGYPSGATLATIWHYGNATDYARLIHDVATSKLLAQAYVGGVQRCSLDLGTVSIGAPHAVAFAWADNDFSASIDGATAVVGGSGTAPTGMTTLYFAQDSAGATGAACLNRSTFLFNSAIDPESAS